MAGIETSLGVIPIVGAITDRPKVLGITGALALPDDARRLPAVVGPDWDGLVADLPGNRTPSLAETSIPAWARAFDEVIDQFGRPTIVLGLSVGGLVALGLKKAAHVIALDPPLMTGKMWPLIPDLTAFLNEHPQDGPWMNTVVGVYGDHVENRDYRDLLVPRPCPTDVICGDEPLFPIRDLPRFPSFVDEPERALIRRQATLHIAPACGHAVHFQGGPTLYAVLMKAMAGVAARDRAG